MPKHALARPRISLSGPPHDCYSRRSDASVHHQTYIVPLQQNAANGAACLLLHLNLFSIINYQVHVLIETQDASLDSQIGLLVKPNLNTIPILQVAEYLIDR